MDHHEEIIQSLNKLIERLKGTEFEGDAERTRKEISVIMKEAEIEEDVERSYEEYLGSLAQKE